MRNPRALVRVAILVASAGCASVAAPPADGGPDDAGSVDNARDAGDVADAMTDATFADAGNDATPAAAVFTDPDGTPAVRARQLLAGIGINTHLDFPGYRMIGIPAIETAVEYVGSGELAILRDSPAADDDRTTWAKVAQDTGVKFDAFLAQGGPSVYQEGLTRAEAMAASGGDYLFALEGGDEEDGAYATDAGNSLAQAAAFQPVVWDAGVKLGLPVLQLSFGAGWSTSTTGDYGTVGDLSAYATFANAHTYPQQNPAHDIAALISDARLPSPGKPVAHSEFGWSTFPAGGSNDGYGWCSETAGAAYDLTFVLDAFAAGSPYYFRYELFDDDALENASAWGLFYDDGTPKASATALRVLFQLLGDTGDAATTFSPGRLDFTVSGLPPSNGTTGGHELLLQKSDGTFWLALWNEQPLNDPGNANRDLAVATVPVTLTLAHPAQALAYYDLLSGTSSPSRTATATASMSLDLPAHPVLLEIIE